jgi:hypothetical protein
MFPVHKIFCQGHDSKEITHKNMAAFAEVVPHFQ